MVSIGEAGIVSKKLLAASCWLLAKTRRGFFCITLNLDCAILRPRTLGLFGLVEKQAAAQDNDKDEPDLPSGQ